MRPLGVVEIDPLADDPFGPEAVGQFVQVSGVPCDGSRILIPATVFARKFRSDTRSGIGRAKAPRSICSFATATSPWK